MKIEKNIPLLLFLSSFSIVICSQAQIQLKNIELGKNVPSQWTDSIIKRSRWALIELGTIEGRKIKQVAITEKKDITYNFSSFYCEILPGWEVLYMQKVDTFKTFNIKYFPEENTMSITLDYDVGIKGFYKKYYKIVYLQNGDLILEEIDVFHFDTLTGKVLTEEQSKKMIEENIMKSGQGLFGANQINIGAKKVVEPRNFLIFKSVN
jgi:hypothetical protein